jgi:hypothetical protein
MMLGTYGAEANPANRQKAADTRTARLASKREDLARRLEALKGGDR